MSTTIGNLAVILSANAAGFTSGFAAAQKTAGSFIGTMGMMARSALPLVGIGSAVGVVSQAFKGFTGAEESRITFQALLGSADKAKAFKAELKDFGDMTSFGDGVGAAAKELLKFNFSQESVIPTLKQLGDIAAGVNVPLEELASVVGKSGYRANISGKQLIALTEMGVPIMQELSRTMNLSQHSITQLAEQGGIKFDDLMGAMRSATSQGGNFFGMMEARANTTKGWMGRIVEQSGDVIAKLGSVLGDRISSMFGVKSGFSTVFDWLQNVEEGVKKMGPWFDNIILAVRTIGDVANSVWGGMSSAFQTAFSIIGGGVDAFGQKIGGFRDMFIDAMLSVRFVFNNFGDFFNLTVGKMVLKLWGFAGDAIHLFTKNIPESFKWLSENWRTLWDNMVLFAEYSLKRLHQGIIQPIVDRIARGMAIEFEEWGILAKGTWKEVEKASIAAAKNPIQPPVFKQVSDFAFSKRTPSDAEKGFAANLESIEKRLGDDKQRFFDSEKALLRQPGFFEGFMKSFATIGKEVGAANFGELAAKQDKGKNQSYAGAFEAGSKEAYNVLVKSRDAALAPANRTAKATEDIAKLSNAQLKLLDEINQGIADTSSDWAAASIDLDGAF